MPEQRIKETEKGVDGDFGAGPREYDRDHRRQMRKAESARRHAHAGSLRTRRAAGGSV